MPQPIFTADPSPLAAFIAFVMTPGAGWGADLAAIQGDDFDDVLAAIPPDVVGWHILSRDTGYIVAGSDPGHDRRHPGIAQGKSEVELHSTPHERTPVDQLVVFRRHDATWGAWNAAFTTDNPLEVSLDDQVLYTQDSQVRGPAGSRTIPTLDQMKAFEQKIAEWQLEEEAMGRPQKVEAAVEARAQVFMQKFGLPDGWSDLSTEELREAVETAEKAVLEATGKTPEDIRQERHLHEHALAGAVAEVTTASSDAL